MQTLILIRGLPGSGKSTLAKILVKAGVAAVHFEADQYFMIDGEYQFNSKEIGYAHVSCQNNTQHALKAGWSVVVSNTFSENWEMRRYFKMAAGLKIPIQVIECQGQFGNIHNVPEQVIKNMADRWEKLEIQS